MSTMFSYHHFRRHFAKCCLHQQTPRGIRGTRKACYLGQASALVLGQELVEVLGQGGVLGHDQSGSLLVLSESCKQTSSSNVFRFASSMSMRCIRRGFRMLCNIPCGYSLGQCLHR